MVGISNVTETTVKVTQQFAITGLPLPMVRHEIPQNSLRVSVSAIFAKAFFFLFSSLFFWNERSTLDHSIQI